MSGRSTTVIFDGVCPRAYSGVSLQQGGIGGTEAMVIGLAESLDLEVMQHNRTAADGRYLPVAGRAGVGNVIVLRDPDGVATARRLFPAARILLWCHDRIEPGSTRARQLLKALPAIGSALAGIVCVSESQRKAVEATLRNASVQPAPPTTTIYNAIADDLLPDATPVDPDKLLFASSPNKGLDYALAAFASLRRHRPQLRLHVTNPGYKRNLPTRLPGVTWLGALPRDRGITEMRSALAVFSPNFVLPETFGLVFAEANAVGTPVLAHDVGAAREVLDPRQPVLPVKKSQRILARAGAPLGSRLRCALAGSGMLTPLFADYRELIDRWRAGGRPVVAGSARFRRSAVDAAWRSLLAADD
ncbi:MAG: glycosyltransferase family 4 protein [Steroidobacteraceae bacterium]